MFPTDRDYILSAEANDVACNFAQSEGLIVEVDRTSPAAPSIAINPLSSDTGVEGYPSTFTDLVTSDTSTGFTGQAEADTIVRLLANGVFHGLSVALPEDGNQAFPSGRWYLDAIHDLNDPAFFPLDGLRAMTATAEDRAGNVSLVGTLNIFVDTAGPQITAVHITDNPATARNEALFDLFDPKPQTSGPTPRVESLTIELRDLPNRIASFLYDAIQAGVASQPGHYIVRGDHNGIIPVSQVVVTTAAIAGSPATATIELRFSSPLPDDRFTLTIDDGIVDPAGNSLDGENNAREPLETPLFPSGDGQPGGSFTARFTVDTRPEIGTFALGTTFIDINGNSVVDPQGNDNDYTNRDIAFLFGFRDDKIFAGNFAPAGAASATGFDKLGAFGNAGAGAAWHWRLDFNHDGVIDFDVLSGVQNSADPVAGNFSPTHPGDEIGLFNSGKWYLDTGGDNNVGGPGDTQLNGNMKGQPIVGDFDGDGKDDLGAWDPGNAGTNFDGVFQFDLASNGLTGVADKTINFDVAGTFQRAIAADMNSDGIDDIGLFVSRREAIDPSEAAEWYFLVSGSGVATPGQVTALNHPFTPVPFGNDIFAQFGDEAALPVVGNFDPPTDSIAFSDPDTNVRNPLDVDNDSLITPLDALLVINYLNSRERTEATTSGYSMAPFLDVSGDGAIAPLDTLMVLNYLNSRTTYQTQAEGEAADAYFEDLGAANDSSTDDLSVAGFSEAGAQRRRRQ